MLVVKIKLCCPHWTTSQASSSSEGTEGFSARFLFQPWANNFFSPYLSSLLLTECKTIVWLISELYGPKNQALFVSVTDIRCLPLFGYLLMGLLKQIYGFFGIHAGKIWHAALHQWPQDSWMSQAVSSSTHWQLQRVLIPFSRDKVWNAGRRKRGTARQEQPEQWDRLFRKGTGAECLHYFLPLWKTTGCFSRISPEGSQEQESQTHRRSTFTRQPQQSPHFAR